MTVIESMVNALEKSEIIPDCRVDDQYNQDFLPQNEQYDMRGYDWCVEAAVDSFFDNLDIRLKDNPLLKCFLNTELPEGDKAEYEFNGTMCADSGIRTIETYGDLLRYYMLDHMEAERNELIMSIIEGLDACDRTKYREEALKENEHSDNPKEYYDSVHFAKTGEKRFRRETIWQ